MPRELVFQTRVTGGGQGGTWVLGVLLASREGDRPLARPILSPPHAPIGRPGTPDRQAQGRGLWKGARSALHRLRYGTGST